MSQYLDVTLRPALRLFVLEVLYRSPGAQVHEYNLRDILDASGLRVSQALIHNDLEWLRDQRLVTLETIEDAYLAQVTQTGSDVADGRETVSGVARPSLRPGR